MLAAMFLNPPLGTTGAPLDDTGGGPPGPLPFPSGPPLPLSPAPPPGPPADQTPERSGLPTGVLGVGPAGFGCPFANLGAPAVGVDGHCARTATEKASKPTIAALLTTLFSIKFSFFNRLTVRDPARDMQFAQFYFIRRLAARETCNPEVRSGEVADHFCPRLP